MALCLGIPKVNAGVRPLGRAEPAMLGAQNAPFTARINTLKPVLPAAHTLTQRSVVVRSADAAAAIEGWWTKELPSNLKHIDSVQELVDELAEGARNDELVVVDFFAPWCRACKAVFPKFKKLCAENPDVRFLAINFDENKGLARGLGVKVLPFFHFYRGAEGRVDAFSASVTKVAKLREAIEDYKSPRCFLEELPANPLPEFPSVLPGGKLGKPSGNAVAQNEPELVA